jgi:hypothetical protein
VAQEIERLVERALKDRRRLGHVDLGAIEFKVRESVHGIGRVLLEQLLQGEHGQCGPRIDCGQGHQAEFVSYRTKQLTTVLGSVELCRAYYHCVSCVRGLIPTDAALDVADTSFSPGVRRLMARVGAQEPFDAGRQDLAELAGVQVHTKEVERISEQCGQQIEQAAGTERVAWRVGKVVPLKAESVLYIAIDGTGVPVVPRELEGREGKQGKPKTREAKLACVFTQTTVDADGYAVRDPGSTSYVGAIETVDAFSPRAKAEAVRRGLQQATRVVVLGDGAPWIWHLATEQFPDAVHIVDLYHAREHLAGLGKLVYGVGSSEAKAWTAARFDDLDAGQVDAVVHAIGQLPTTTEAAREQARKDTDYFQTNSLRMCYRYFRSQGFFVGSGAIEAGCKTVVGQRLKQSGMRWTVDGANAVIALRCSLLSDRWEEFWMNRAAS